jgi:hypothetical protein
MIRREDIIKPLIFLDIFDYPPTAVEVWRFLGVPAELGEVVDFYSPLERGAEPGEAGCVTAGFCSSATQNPPRPSATPPEEGTNKNGFYFLSGREELIKKRREFFELSEKKFKIAKRAAWLLHFIPIIKMIAVCNNFYYRPQSDIDFFIITAANRLWLTRFFATIILDIFYLRARGKKTADKVCLSFYLSEDNLNLEKIALAKNKVYFQEESDPSRGAQDDKNEKDDKIDDPYLSYWLAFLEPIYGQECYNRFWGANNWIKNIFPNILPKEPVARRQVGGEKSREYTLPVAEAATPLPRGGLFIGDWQELIAKKIQGGKISPRVKEMAALGDTRVVINDKMLKFHENDRREEFRNQLKVKSEKFKI